VVVNLRWRPTTPFRVQNSCILSRLDQTDDGANIFDNRIFRSNLGYQFTREFSLRAIVQYDFLRAHSLLYALAGNKNWNADLLLTYQVNPWTVIYLGSNSNWRHADDLVVAPQDRPALVAPQSAFFNDGRQVFVKFSYLFSY